MENSIQKTNDWKTNAVSASRKISLLDDEVRNKVLLAIADSISTYSKEILEANAVDLSKMDSENPMYDRLLLNEDRLSSIAEDIRNVAKLASPLDKIISEVHRPNEMTIKKISVPFGVVGIIYEARPNVTFDVFSLCFKSGNVCVLKGGSDAYESNLAITTVIQSVLKSFDLDVNFITLLSAGRDSAAELMNAVGTVDVIIPRGGQGLINFVREHSKVPVIETGAGVVHTYFDKDGDLEKGKKIVFNSKTRRVSVCNALDCLILHKDRLSDLAELVKELASTNVLIYADSKSYESLKAFYPNELLQTATEESFGTEFLSYKMAVKTVSDIDEALQHIADFSSKHSECIITENEKASDYFTKRVDAACVYTNVSTAFTDGAQFGLGAEIGISTQKLHARGPMALAELCSYKWLISGDGQIRN